MPQRFAGRGFASVALALLIILSGCDRPGDADFHPQNRFSVKRVFVPVKTKLEVQAVRFPTDDGLTLRGKLFGGKSEDGAGVILAHMFGADQTSWLAFARDLANRGYVVLTFDFRGYGWSEGTREVLRADRDVSAAIRFMERRTDKVFLIGASMGGTAALLAASKYPVAGVAVLSAPESFRGLSVGNKMDKMAGAKLFLAAGRDGKAPETARRFYARVGEPRELEIVSGGAHGTDMLEDLENTVGDMLVTWLAKSW